MFRKIVSNLPFSPALVGQLGFYSKKLRKEKTSRQLALIFVVLALVVQSLAIFQPPTSANASSLNDMVNGGLGQSLNNFMSPYDSNTRNLKDIMNYVGITRSEITSAQYTSWKADTKFVWGLVPHFSYSQGERQYNLVDSNNQQTVIIYSRPLKLTYNSNELISGWVGNSKKIGWFAIVQASGNLVTEITPPISSKCNSKLLTNDPLCSPGILESKTAINTSQGSVNAATVTASEGDQINYTITITNNDQGSTSTALEDNLSDVLEYTTLIDNGGGTLSSAGVLSWPDITLNPGDTQTRTFVVRLLDSIPSTAQGVSDLTSYDCKITNVFGNLISINVNCPTPKIIEKITTELPKIGPIENLIFAIIVLGATAYFYARTRQIEKEIRLIRKNTNIGII